MFHCYHYPKLYLAPDFKDGVVLTIAPLWELVPWKEVKMYWNEVLAGKYEWSFIGKQLRDKGWVKEAVRGNQSLVEM